ncbi:hypothetical protein, variant [Aphanomyces astaci]|nr:hypothetical protein, variant [Aphanomyces astaci]ETV68509.1 hypothetical protein, variant [Aphanomyces astaci]|eukprot:XP_009841938.1 hypothetical protein, variant [Aphanomyces astaci]
MWPSVLGHLRRHAALPGSNLRAFSSVVYAGVATASADKLDIEWTDGLRSSVDLFHLRAWCTCPQCEHSTGQRLLNITDAPLAPRVSSVQVAPNNAGVHIEWAASGPQTDQSPPHATYLSSAAIRKLTSDPTTAASLTPPTLASNAAVSSVDFAALSSDDGVLALCEHIHRDGLAIVRHVPSVPGTVRDVAERIAPISHTHLYGSVFDVVAEHNPVNIAYTSERLKLHLDLAYYESPPGLQLLHALRYDATVEGGNSTFRDTFDAAETLRRRHPDHFKLLTRVPATFQKIHIHRTTPAILEYHRPHIALNDQNEVTAMFWSPPFEGVPTRIPAEKLPAYYAAYRALDEIIQENVIEFKLKQGELVVFNQRR